VRPTTERVREALFSSLAPRLADASVLDLYAGSGAMAIEALSRGAARAVLVDRARTAVSACRDNLESMSLTDRARVVERDAAAFLAAAAPREAPFDLVLFDPPYESPGAELAAVLERLGTPGWMSAHGVVVVERPAGAAGIVAWPTGWTVGWERRYGDTLVSVVSAV
jgi:16S rRNA (guanine966-N2)-methyltransferase